MPLRYSNYWINPIAVNAGAVLRNRRKAAECPSLDSKTAAELDAPEEMSQDGEGISFLKELKAKAASIDLAEAARRIKARFEDGRLTLKVMGKDFTVDSKGELFAEIHINPWVAVPFLQHVLNGKGVEPKGDWVSFRELKGGRERYPLFQKRCELALKKVADAYTELFDLMVQLFGGKKVAPQFQSDISVVLYPLPLVPMMICYWLAAEGMDSSINVFFDRSAEENLDIDSVFELGVGFARMVSNLSIRHGMKATC